LKKSEINDTTGIFWHLTLYGQCLLRIWKPPPFALTVGGSSQWDQISKIPNLLTTFKDATFNQREIHNRLLHHGLITIRGSNLVHRN